MPVLTPPDAEPRPTTGVGRGPMRLRHPGLSVTVAAVVGALATGAGAGLGVRYLQKTGFTVVTVLGLALLASGLALLGYAAVSAWRLLHRWARLWLVPGLLAVLVLVSSLGQAVMYAVVPPTALGPATPADRGMPYRDVSFRTADGVRLSAWLVPSRNGAAVALLHGSGSTRTAVLLQAEVLARHGYGLLLVDARGHGRSGGRGMDLGWWGDRDVTAAVSFLQHQTGVDPARIGVLGLSMGGEEAIGAAAADPRIRAVVAEGATQRTADDKAGWLPGGVSGAAQRGLDRLTFGLTDLLTPASPPTSLYDAVAAARADFLLITAGTMPDEARAARHFASAAPARVRTWNVAGATHTHALTKDPTRWEREVVGFFDSRLRPA